MSTVFIKKMVGTEAQASVSTSCPWDYHIQTRVNCNSRILNIFILHFAYWILHFSSLRLFEIKLHVNCIYKQNGWNRGASPWDYHIQTWVKCTSRIFNICILQFSSLREFEIKIHVNCLYKQNGWNRGASLCFNKLPLRLSHPNMGQLY